MKLYTGKHMGKRRLKKALGYSYRLLSTFNLKVGDLVQTCEGVNRRVTGIRPEYYNGRRRFIVNFLVATEGCGCSYLDCIEPAKTKEQIVQDWSEWLKPNLRSRAEAWGMHSTLRIAEAAVAGEELFDELGQPTELWVQMSKDKGPSV